MTPLCHPLHWIEPADAAARVVGCDGLAFLDSGGAHGDLGRWSVLGIEPFARFRVAEGQAYWNDIAEPEAPLAALRTRLAAYAFDRPSELPFAGGVIGTIDYEFQPEIGAGGLSFGLYDLVAVFDRATQRAWICASGFPETDPDRRAARAAERLAYFQSRLAAAAPPAGQAALGPWQTFTDEAGYAAAVTQVCDHIRDGDIYQANISQAFEAEVSGDPWALYQALRTANPAPFAAYITTAQGAILSASPERFLELRQGQATARPIKGTAKRVADPTQDHAIAAALVASEKDRAENVMIVDLMRNDLSRVCDPGTVAVPELCRLETYASVHHLTSVVTGTLASGADALDLLAATFPGGSITGAPKERAMDIIRAIEGRDRGVYCGAIGYIGFDGDMDLNIPIRTVTLANGRATLQAGGGVTLLSDGAAEYAETLAKASRIFEALAPFQTESAAWS